MSDFGSGGGTANPVQAARAALDASDFAAAVPLLREAILDDPGDAALRADLGVALESLGDLDGATQAYAAAAALEPENPIYHFNQGAVAQAQGRAHDAATHYVDALEREPLFAEAYYNLGTLFFEIGEFEIACEHYGNALKARPDYAEAASNLGLALRRLGRQEEAVIQFRHALALRPDLAQTHSNLAVVLLEVGEFDEAIACYGRALSFEPTNPSIHVNLSLAWRGRGRTDLAAESVLRALVLAPDHAAAQIELGSVAAALAKEGNEAGLRDLLDRWRRVAGETPVLTHTMAALGLAPVPDRAADNYVAQMFDASSKRFDEMIGSLGYQGPTLIAGAMARHAGEATGALDVLDAGCGTGLSGTVLRDYARQLIGVDLSLGMLRQADRRGIYDRLEQAELEAFLIACPDSFDVAAFGDVLCYFGDVTALFRAAAGSLHKGGLIIGTVEATSGEVPYRLGPSGRYAHQPAYIQQTLTEAGFQILEITPCVLRHESGQPVEGVIAVGRRL
ncbi:tetratricopeptide repeat protein [Niveispirillum irakense]|uniref:tetratricopeptide repeat protein n=1 Tax=Niveispirillum irakense TaxID=34011 RepID=UPI0003F55294|nr:tetratricopeptide repeat protein [Niveispirillum irakense]